MDKNDEKILANAKHNLEYAKEQFEKYKDNDSVPEETKKLLRQNYENAQQNVKNFVAMDKKMAAAVADDLQKANATLNDAKGNTAKLDKARLDENPHDDIVLPGKSANTDITIHMPDSAELRSAISYSNASRTKIQMPLSDTKSAEPAAKSAEPVAKVPEAKPDKKAKKPVTKKMSTREAMREAARQAFIGSPKKAKKKKATTKVKKTTKKADSESKDNSTMTREQYRKLHNQKK